MKTTCLVLALITLFFSAGAVWGDDLSEARKIEIIFNYAESCNWLAPSRCGVIDPNITENPALTPYRELCQERSPARCLSFYNLIPETDPPRSPLSPSSFVGLENIIHVASQICNLKQEGWARLCEEEDRRLHPQPRWPWDRDRRIFRTYYAIDPGEGRAFVFWPWELAKYAGWCGVSWDQFQCLAFYAPARPPGSLRNQQINTIFNYAESCNWLAPSRCGDIDPNITENPTLTPYRELCQERSPARCLSFYNLIPETDPPRSPLSPSSFVDLENSIHVASQICNLKQEGWARLCEEEDRRLRPPPQWAWERDRRIFRTYYAIDPGEGRAFVFWPWDLGKYAGLCGTEWSLFQCLNYYAPRRPTINFVGVPWLFPELGGPSPMERAGEGAGRRDPPPPPPSSGESTGPGSGSGPPENPMRGGEPEPPSEPVQDQSMATGGGTLKCSLSFISNSRVSLSFWILWVSPWVFTLWRAPKRVTRRLRPSSFHTRHTRDTS